MAKGLEKGADKNKPPKPMPPGDQVAFGMSPGGIPRNPQPERRVTTTGMVRGGLFGPIDVSSEIERARAKEAERLKASVPKGQSSLEQLVDIAGRISEAERKAKSDTLGTRRDKSMHESSEPDGFWHRHWSKAWPVVRQAPVPFAICTLIAAGVFACAVYWYEQNRYEAVLAGKDATIQFLSLRPESIPAQEQEIIDLKAKVAEAEARDASLTAKLQSMQQANDKREWPGLTEAQIDAWVEALRPLHIHLLTVYIDYPDFGSDLLRSFRTISKKLGCQVQWGPASIEEIFGISYIYPPNQPGASTLEGLLKSLGPYPVKWDPASNPQPKLDIIIIFGNRMSPQ